MKYKLLTILSVMSWQLGFAQCAGNKCDLMVNQTGTCQGDSVQIEAKTTGVFVGWKNQDGTSTNIGNPSRLKTKVLAVSPCNYIARSQFMSANMISNGDFELGRTGFSSDYNYKDTVFKTGDYSIGKNPKLTTNSRYTSQKDHTTGSGFMLIADGSSDSTKAIYRTSASVQLGKEYVFNTWVSNVHSEFKKAQPDTSSNKSPVFQLFIDGQLVSSFHTPLDTIWHQFSYSWKSSANKSITIELKDLMTTNKANDFAIDDIYLGSVNIEEATIAVQACKPHLNTLPVLSPDGDGNHDTYYIAEPGNAKIIDLTGNVIGELNSPVIWDGTTRTGSMADAGYYAIVVNNTTIYRVSLIR